MRSEAKVKKALPTASAADQDSAKTAGATQAPEATPEKKTRTRKAATEPKPKRISAIDAAAEVLRKAGKPMRCTEMIQAMDEQGLWSSPNGKTPAATLYAAVIRELATKGDAARFRKVERGQFEFNAPVAVGA